MDLFSVVIYGLLQGIMEFLPVSSSAHLAVLPKLMHMQDPGVSFDLMLHVGTAMAVVVYFRHMIFGQIRIAIPALTQWRDQRSEFVFLRNFSISIIGTFVVSVALKHSAEQYGRSPVLIAILLAVFGIVMWIADRASTRFSLEQRFSVRRALAVGIAQALAVFPGVSRSGITITMARFLGVSREESSRYSFLLSLPVILGAAAIHAVELVRGGDALFSWSACGWGIALSFIVGMLTIHFFMKLIAHVGLWVFTLYRVALAIVLIAMFW